MENSKEKVLNKIQWNRRETWNKTWCISCESQTCKSHSREAVYAVICHVLILTRNLFNHSTCI